MQTYEFVIMKFRNPKTTSGILMSLDNFWKKVAANADNVKLDYSFFNGKEWSVKAVFQTIIHLRGKGVDKFPRWTVNGDSLKYNEETKRIPFDVEFVRVVGSNYTDAVKRVQDICGYTKPFIVTNSSFDSQKECI